MWWQAMQVLQGKGQLLLRWLLQPSQKGFLVHKWQRCRLLPRTQGRRGLLQSSQVCLEQRAVQQLLWQQWV